MPTILVVDDSPSIRAMLSQALQAAGYTVLTAADGKQGIALLSQPLDLIVTDIFMPEADGLELIMALRKLPRRPPVIAMSSKSGPVDMLHSARGLGAILTLKKPFISADLVHAVGTILRQQDDPSSIPPAARPPLPPHETHHR